VYQLFKSDNVNKVRRENQVTTGEYVSK
jgi:hypothetical protein